MTSFLPGWWSPGLALHERPPLRVRQTLSTTDAWRRLDGWREASRLGPEFAGRLAECGHDAASAAYLLVESTRDLADRVPIPEWAQAVQQALQEHPYPPRGAGGTGTWQAAFAEILHPLVAYGRSRLLSGLHPEAAAQVNLEAIAAEFATDLGHQLARLAARTLVTRLDRRRRQGLLTGQDGASRFEDFVRHQASPDRLADLLQEYPVLARLLSQAARNAADAHLDLFARFIVDRGGIVENLLDGIDPGPIDAVQPRRGDTHMRGRSVAIVAFADGRRVVYKPRDLAAQHHFGELVTWLNSTVDGVNLLAPRVLPRPGYGWAQFIARRDLSHPGGADRFYLHMGALLALLHVLRAADVNCENVIACGDQPVLVDAEALFHPSMGLPDRCDPALRTLKSSVHRTALLPRLIVSDTGVMDVSAVGGDPNTPTSSVVWEDAGTDRMRLARKAVPYSGALNRPRLGDREFDPVHHEASLIEGFRLAYDAIEKRRDDLLARIEKCAAAETRIVVRPTLAYSALIEESTHPNFLRDGLVRDRLFDRLWQLPDGDQLRRGAARHEVGQLWDGDIPIFFGRPGSRDLLTHDGVRIPDVLRDTGLDNAAEKIGAMGEAERQDQEWIISATLATRRPAPSHVATPTIAGTATATATVADPDLLLAAACGLADRIVARGLGDTTRVNWLGLEHVDDRQWLVLPMGAGFAHGYLGVAVFLAQLAALTGIGRYDAVARRALAPVPELCEELVRQPIAVQAIGCGGMNGFGGMAYALARLSTLLNDDRIRASAELAVGLAARACEGPCQPGVADGMAGCLAAMLAVHDELGLAAAATLAAQCADRLADVAELTDGRCDIDRDKAATGFAVGCAGVGWALTRFARDGRPSRFADAGAHALAQTAKSQDSGHGWCSGTAGLAAARAGIDPDRAVATLSNRPVLRDLSLCHGETGIVEALTVLAARNDERGLALARDRRAGLVLDAIGRYGPLCGTPGQVITPGFQHGLAGIGYGLLRAAFSDRVPSALLLEPTPR